MHLRFDPWASRRRRATALSILVLLVLLAAATVTGAPGGASAAGTSTSPTALVSATAPATPTATPAPAPDSPADCAALATGWEFLDGDRPSPAILPSLESPCALDHDVAGLYFVSTAAGSGDRAEFTLTLPANGTDPGGAYSAFWLGMWVSGIGCSYDGASYLTVELIPPFATDAGVAGVPWWTVQAPVWDLVPPGSCDAQCENDTAFFTVAGRSYCEDDALVAGVGALTGAGQGAFDPGDALTVALVGTAGGTAPLSVYVNDTTESSRSLSWNYSGFATGGGGHQTLQTVTGNPLVPLYENASSANGGWTGGLDIGYGWYNCPVPLGSDSYASACNSYDGSIAPGASPEIDRVAAWNRTSHTYSDLYPTVESSSSSAACAGTPGVAPCADFTTYGGSGDYPVFGVGGTGGRAWLTYGPADASNLATLGGGAREFPADGNLSAPLDPTVVDNASVSEGSNSATVVVRVSDPVGVSRVAVSAWWCNSGLKRSVASFPASIVTAPFNTPLDGNWSVQVPTSGDTGSFYYFVRAISNDGVATSGAEQNITLTGTGSACPTSYPAAPSISPSSIEPIGSGYSLSWTENASSGVTAFSVVATPTHGGSPSVFPVGNATSTSVVGLAGHVVYNLTVVAYDPLGLATPSAIVTGPETELPLAIQPLNLSDSSPWSDVAVLGVSDNVTGGAPPYEFDLSFGDGTSDIVWSTSGDASAVHPFPANYSGIAVVSATVVDSSGDTIRAPTQYVSVQGPPTGLRATLSGGSSFVQLRWSAPSSPGPLTRYEVFWTTDPDWAPYLTAAWPSNASVPEISTAYVHASPFTIAAPDGTEVYAQVVAWNAYGEGLLPATSAIGDEPYLSATASSLGGTLLATDAGGPAPFTDALNASFVLAPGDALTNATYRFSTGGPESAAIASDGTSFWANASVTFETPGLVEVYLYVTDRLNQSTVLYTSVYVSPGVAPLVSVRLDPTPVWVNSSVELSASASGGSGHYAYNWSLGDGGTATGSVVNYSYVLPGTYLVSVVVTDTEWGGTTDESAPVTVTALPTVQIVETSAGTSGTYRFTAIPYGGLGNFSYTWLFGDGSTGTGSTVTHTWAGAGNYSVTVQATDGYGHVTTTSIFVVVPSSTGTTQNGAGSGASLDVVGALVILVIALAVVAGILAYRQYRRPPAEEADPTGEYVGDGTEPSSDAPADAAVEEPPPYQ